MKIKHLILAFGGASLLAACNLDEYPYGFYSEDNFYKTEADAESAVNYIYDAINYIEYSRSIVFLGDMNTDDMEPKGDAAAANKELDGWKINNFKTNTTLGNFYKYSYITINRANAVIKKVPGMNIDEGRRNRFLGEAYFMRAFQYHELTEMFGRVPLILSTSQDSNSPQATEEELYGQMGADLLRAIGLHTIYVLISVVIGFAAGLVFGILLSRIPRWLSGIIIPILSIFQTIPGLVFIGVLFIWWGNIYPTVIVALSVYAMFPVLKNTYTGILEVEPKYIEAAKGCGMSSFQTLVRVELPLAMPVIISGLRMAAIYTVSWAVLASMIGLGGLGDFVYRGTSSNNNTLILLGAIPAAILAVLFGLVIDLLQKRVTPRGLRKEAGK